MSRADVSTRQHEFLPAFVPLALLALCGTLHALATLAQRWSVRWRVRVRCARVPRAAIGGLLLVEPPAHQGRAAVVRVRAAPGARGATHGVFEFQRQRFELDVGAQRVAPLRCPVDAPLRAYTAARGLSASDVLRVGERFGDNSVDVPAPTFLDVFARQILGPVPVFQLFVTLLWLLDEYWSYAIFHFVMICMLEASTAFSRMKSVASLRGMRSEAGQVYVRRDGAWQLVPTTALLPGDVFSVPDAGGRDGASAAAADGAAAAADEGSSVSVPCDALILRGSAVVNEASLTGERCARARARAVQADC